MESPRAESLIAEVYAQTQRLRTQGRVPRFVDLCPEHYRLIQEYWSLLGLPPGDLPDYIERYRLFGLEICIESIDAPRVRE